MTEKTQGDVQITINVMVIPQQIHFQIQTVPGILIDILFVFLIRLVYYIYSTSCFAIKLGPLLSPSLIWLRSTPVPGDHGEGQVLAVLALDRGDKSLRTPEDSLPVGKLGTSLSRPCHTLPCR